MTKEFDNAMSEYLEVVTEFAKQFGVDIKKQNVPEDLFSNFVVSQFKNALGDINEALFKQHAESLFKPAPQQPEEQQPEEKTSEADQEAIRKFWEGFWEHNDNSVDNNPPIWNNDSVDNTFEEQNNSITSSQLFTEESESKVKPLRFISVFEDKDMIAEKLGIKNPESVILTNFTSSNDSFTYDVIVDSSVEIEGWDDNRIGVDATERHSVTTTITTLKQVINKLQNHKETLIAVYGHETLRNNTKPDIPAIEVARKEYRGVIQELSILNGALNIMENNK